MNIARPTGAASTDSPPGPPLANGDAAASPVDDQTTAEGESRSRAIVGPDTAPQILLIGEDPLMTRTVERLLQRAGYQVRTGDQLRMNRNADEARPALVIVDVPDDWTRVTAQFPIPEGPFIPPVLWISNRTLAGIGAPHALVKPFTASDLLDAVEVLLHPSAPVQ